jgi:uncharacterized protein (DUF2132 family)
MSQEQPKNPLHGVTLKTVLVDLVARRGWGDLAERVPINCFLNEPSLKSSLKFLRKTPWARAQIEQLYLADQAQIQRNRKRNKRRASQRAYRADLEAAQAMSSHATGEE